MGAEKRRRRRNSIDGAFAPRLVEMLESPPYSVLSQSAHRVLSRIEIELAHHGGADNHALPVTFSDFEIYGIERHAVAPAIRECVALMFLTWKPGAAGNAEFRRPGLFGLTYRHSDYSDPTHDWRRIKTVSEAWQLARTARFAVARKSKASAGIPTVSVRQTPTETASAPVGDSRTTAKVGIPAPLSRFPGGTHHTGASERAALMAGDATTTHHPAPLSDDLTPVADAVNSIIEIIRPRARPESARGAE